MRDAMHARAETAANVGGQGRNRHARHAPPSCPADMGCLPEQTPFRGPAPMRGGVALLPAPGQGGTRGQALMRRA
jgi:hypothetical protein